jgi:hypothetical protein
MNSLLTSVSLVHIELLCNSTRKLYPFVSLPDEEQRKKERRRRKGERADSNKFHALSPPLLITRQQIRFRPTQASNGRDYNECWSTRRAHTPLGL